MSDYISRQAAINAVKNEPFVTAITNPFFVAVESIKKLPSADVQPHQLTEEDLTELRHRFGKDVECVVRDMISGKEERWMI